LDIAVGSWKEAEEAGNFDKNQTDVENINTRPHKM